MDFGTFSVRAGYAGEDSPKVEFPSTIGKFLICFFQIYSAEHLFT